MASLEPVKTWEEPLADFLLHYKATRSPNTHDFYAAQLKTLASWAAGEGIAFQDFRPRHLDRFVIYRRESGMKETTIHHGAACTKKFFGWCAKNELTDRDYLKDVRVSNAPMPPRRVIANADMEKFLAGLWTFRGICLSAFPLYFLPPSDALPVVPLNEKQEPLRQVVDNTPADAAGLSGKPRLTLPNLGVQRLHNARLATLFGANLVERRW